MINYIDIAFLAITLIMVIDGVCRGLVVSVLGFVKFIVILPLSYFAADSFALQAAEFINEPVPLPILKVGLFIIAFLVLYILFGILMNFLKELQKKKHMPLKHTNALLGGLFSLVKAAVFVATVSLLLGALIEIIPKTNEFYTQISSSYAVESINDIFKSFTF